MYSRCMLRCHWRAHELGLLKLLPVLVLSSFHAAGPALHHLVHRPGAKHHALNPLQIIFQLTYNNHKPMPRRPELALELEEVGGNRLYRGVYVCTQSHKFGANSLACLVEGSRMADLWHHYVAPSGPSDQLLAEA